MYFLKSLQIHTLLLHVLCFNTVVLNHLWIGCDWDGFLVQHPCTSCIALLWPLCTLKSWGEYFTHHWILCSLELLVIVLEPCLLSINHCWEFWDFVFYCWYAHVYWCISSHLHSRLSTFLLNIIIGICMQMYRKLFINSL